jgi:hypothetical protein
LLLNFFAVENNFCAAKNSRFIFCTDLNTCAD